MRILIGILSMSMCLNAFAQIELKQVLFERPEYMGPILQVADFDGDGEDDYIFRNFTINGASMFALWNQRIAWDDSYVFSKAKSGDLDGDGDIDLFAQSTNTWYALINDGSAEFAIEYAEAPSANFLGLTIADNQGKVDVLLENYDEENNIQYFFRSYRDNANAVWKTDSIAATVSCNNNPEDKVYQDFDQDGDKDILFAVDGKVHLLRETGNFEFEHELLHYCDPSYKNLHMIAGPENEVLALLLEGDFPDQQLSEDLQQFELIAVSESGIGDYLLEPHPHFSGPHTVADINQDGIDDFVCDNRESGELVWFLSSYEDSLQYEEVKQDIYSSALPYASRIRFLKVGDDVLYTDSYFWKYCYLSYENESFQDNCLAECAYPGFNNLKVYDVNEDGYQDLVQRGWNKLLYMASDGHGQLSDPSPLYENEYYLAYNWQLLDLDNNDSLDVAYSTASGDFNALFHYDLGVAEKNGEVFGPGVNVFEPLHVDPEFFWTDLNQDSYTDLIVRKHPFGSDTLRVFLNNQDRSFEQPIAMSFDDEASWYSWNANILDWNMDGLPDFVVRSSGSSGGLYYRASSEVGIFADSAQIIVDDINTPHRILLHDWSADGIPDLLIPAYLPGILAVFKGDGLGGVSLFQELPMAPLTHFYPYNNEEPYPAIPPADFNGDGHLDILYDRNLYLWNPAINAFDYYELSEEFPTGDRTLIMDLDSNGKADIIVYSERKVKHFEYSWPVGNEDQQSYDRKIDLYPNPASSKFHLRIPAINCPATLSFYDLYGRQIQVQSIADLNQTKMIEVEVELWPQGIYHYILEAECSTMHGSFALH